MYFHISVKGLIQNIKPLLQKFCKAPDRSDAICRGRTARHRFNQWSECPGSRSNCLFSLRNPCFQDGISSYAVAAIENGDGIKTVQSDPGHATAGFTLNVYGHASQRMKRQSADRLELYIQDFLNCRDAV